MPGRIISHLNYRVIKKIKYLHFKKCKKIDIQISQKINNLENFLQGNYEHKPIYTPSLTSSGLELVPTRVIVN